VKCSRFNRIFRAADGTWLAFNAWSTGLAELDGNDLPFVRAILADPDGTPCDSAHKRDIREALVAAHFLVEDGVDELAELKAGLFRDRFREDALYLTVAPTTDCNFRCDYCYEEHLRVTMSSAVQQELLRFVEQRAPKLSEMVVTWFGGEPLLPRAVQVVRELSRALLDLAAAHRIAYRAMVVTNGYLLDRALMEELAGLGVTQVQVTLDGPPAQHDRRRVLAGGQGTFAKILANLRDTADLASFQIRVNLDRRNALGALDLVELLAREGLGHVPVYVAQVTESGATCGNIDEACFSSAEFAGTELEVYREAARRGLPLARYPQRVGGAFCTADRQNGYVVAPSGAVFKCWQHVTADPARAVLHLLDGEQPFHRANEAPFLAFDPLVRRECPECPVLPLCHGGCPIAALARTDGVRGACEGYKFHLEPLLELRHVYRLPEAPGGAPRGGAASEP
jgi:uncharacterized protein